MGAAPAEGQIDLRQRRLPSALTVIPLLAEYFYEDWSKVAAVLGDTTGERFLERRELRAPNGLDSDGDAPARWRWQVRQPFADDAYKGFA